MTMFRGYAEFLDEYGYEFEEDLNHGFICMMGHRWNRLQPLKRLADVDCPVCGAIYADVGRYDPNYS